MKGSPQKQELSFQMGVKFVGVLSRLSLLLMELETPNSENLAGL